MTLETTLDALRGLGVYIPEGLDDTQLTNLAKALCPWTMTIEPVGDLFCASTRRSGKGEAITADSSGEAGMELVLQHLEGKRYSAFDTQYKTNAARMRGTT